MADVKWIKITTDVFDDEKILMIESLPSADSIIVIWFKLLAFAGKQNNDGVFLMSNRIAYTDEMLASIFRRDVNVVRLALKVFEEYGMIEIVNNVICIPNWNKHQTLDAYEKKKERDRLYQQNRRAAQRALITKSSDSQQTQSSDVVVSEEDREKEKEKEEDIKDIISDSDEPEQCSEFHKKELHEGYVLLTPEEFSDISDHPDHKQYIKKAASYIKKHGEIKGSHYDYIKKLMKETKHRYGEYKNVLLTDDELQKLKTEYSDYEERIERLSSYVASTGKSYKSHYATIRNWARKDQEQGKGRKEMVPDWMKKKTPRNSFNSYSDQRDYDFDALEKELFANEKTVDNCPELAARAEALKQKLGGA